MILKIIVLRIIKLYVFLLIHWFQFSLTNWLSPRMDLFLCIGCFHKLYSLVWYFNMRYSLGIWSSSCLSPLKVREILMFGLTSDSCISLWNVGDTECTVENRISLRCGQSQLWCRYVLSTLTLNILIVIKCPLQPLV